MLIKCPARTSILCCARDCDIIPRCHFVVCASSWAKAVTAVSKKKKCSNGDMGRRKSLGYVWATCYINREVVCTSFGRSCLPTFQYLRLMQTNHVHCIHSNPNSAQTSVDGSKLLWSGLGGDVSGFHSLEMLVRRFCSLKLIF